MLSLRWLPPNERFCCRTKNKCGWLLIDITATGCRQLCTNTCLYHYRDCNVNCTPRKIQKTNGYLCNMMEKFIVDELVERCTLKKYAVANHMMPSWHSTQFTPGSAKPHLYDVIDITKTSCASDVFNSKITSSCYMVTPLGHIYLKKCVCEKKLYKACLQSKQSNVIRKSICAKSCCSPV